MLLDDDGDGGSDDDDDEKQGIAREVAVGKGIMAAVQFSKLRGFLDEGAKPRVERVGGVYHHPDRVLDAASLATAASGAAGSAGAAAKESDRDRERARGSSDPFALPG